MLNNFVSNLKQIFVVLNGKSVDLLKVVSMIDETVTLLKSEWGEDDGKKAYGIESFGQTEDEDKVLAHQISGHTTADYKDQVFNTATVSISQERIQERIVEETVNVTVLQMMEEAVKLIPHDKVHKRTVEKVVDVPIPQIREDVGEVTQLIQQERISDWVVEQIVDVHVPEIRDQIVDVQVPRIRDEKER